jgi:hypothetical protein
MKNDYVRISILSLMWLGLAVPLQSQETRAVVGQVYTANDSTPLSGVHIMVIGQPVQTESDQSGRFVLSNLPRSELRVAFQRIGLTADTLTLGANQVRLTVYLTLAPVSLEPVTAEPAPVARQRFELVAQTSTITLDPIDIANVPTLAEPDPVRAVQLLPGTVAKSDYTVGFNVRGGETDQNLIQLDGVPVFNPSHLGGMFSTFDNSAVQQVEFIAGAYPASYGGRLSSVLDVQFKEGDRNRTNVRGMVSALSAKLLVDGPVGKTGLSYLVGVRRTYADAVLAVFDPTILPYYFADAVAKITTGLPAGGKLALTGYWGRDVLDIPWVDAEPGREGIDLKLDWGNRLLGLAWLQPLGSMHLEQYFSASYFSTGLGLEPDIERLDNWARVLSARTNLLLSPGRANDFRLGVGIEGYEMDFLQESAALETSTLKLHYKPTVYYAYLDDQWRVFQPLLLRAGLRVNHVTGGADTTLLSPRLGLKAFLTKDFALSGSVGRFYQPIHSIRDQEVPITMFEFWIGADDVTPIARSDHAVVGLERWFGTGLSVSIEGFAKSYENIAIQNDADDPKIRGDEFIPASGYARGVDVMIRKYGGLFSGWISYGYVQTERELPTGEVFAPAHDRRHTFDIVVEGKGPFGSSMGVRWGYGSPLPYTGIVGQWLHREYNAELHAFDWFEDEAISTTRNGERFPYYSRLDILFRWEFEKWGGTWRPFLQIVNVYNRTNVWVYSFNYDVSPPTRTGFSQLPIFPTIGVEFEW